MLVRDNYSERCGRRSNSQAARYAYMLRLNLIREVLQSHRRCDLLLDLGGATGDYAIDLQEQAGLTPYLLDKNHSRLFTAGCKSGQIFVIQADAVNLPFQDNTFDVVLMLNSLRYFSSPSRALLECWRVLVPGGLLLIIDHNKLSPDVWLLKEERARCFTPAALSSLLRTSHFEVITMKRLFIPPSIIPAFTVKAIAKSGQRLAPVLGKVYPEIFVLAAKE